MSAFLFSVSFAHEQSESSLQVRSSSMQHIFSFLFFKKKKSNFPDLFCKHCYVFIERFRWTDVSSRHPGLSGGARR